MRLTQDKWSEKLQSWREFLDPTIRFKREKDWFHEPSLARKWSENERPAFRTNSKVFLTSMLIAYLLHAYTDWLGQKPNLPVWMAYRFGCATFALLGLLYTNSRMFQLAKSPRLPLALVGLIFVFMQGQSMVWSHKIPPYFCAAIAVIVTSALRFSIKHSLYYLLLSYAVALPGYLAQREQAIVIFSVSTIGLIGVIVQRSRMSSDVAVLIANERSRDAQQRLIAQEQELGEHLAGWLPKEIWRRVSESRFREHKSILQALDDVLYVQSKFVTTMHTDIRGFTQFSKSYPEFVAKLMAGQKLHTDLIASYSGIPEVIADCIFTYFDLEPAAHSFKNALACAFKITQTHDQMNLQLPEELKIRRYIILSFGLAQVGNHGGVLGSRKITAIGNSCNLLSRVDEATKSANLSEFLKGPKLVLTKAAAELLLNLCPDIKCTEANLEKLGVAIRDFPEERSLFFLDVNQENFNRIVKDSDVVFAEDYIKFNYATTFGQIEREAA